MNLTWWDYDAFAEEIIKALEDGKNVYIKSGAANDKITDYERYVAERLHHTDAHISFDTTACIFPKTITLDMYDNVETEEFNGSLFVKVW